MASSLQRLNKQQKRNIIISAVSVLVVLIIGYLLISSRAAGFFALIDPSSTQVTGNATLVSDASATGGKVIQFNAPSTPPPTTPPPTTPPPTGTLMGWHVNENNVGLKPHGLTCDSLPLYNGPMDLPAGTTISGKRIEGFVNAAAGNITVEKSCIRPNGSDWGYIFEAAYFDGSGPNGSNIAAKGPVTIRDSEIDASRITSLEGRARSDGIRGSANIYRNYIHGMGTGISIAVSDNKLSIVIENNYVTNMTAYGDGAGTGTHSSAFTVRDFPSGGTGRTITIRNNRFNCAGGNETGAHTIQTTFGVIDNLLSEGNLLEGYSYNSRLERYSGTGYSNIKMNNNRFLPGPKNAQGQYIHDYYGPALAQGGGAGYAQWTENYMYDSAKTDGKGAAVGKPNVNP